MTGSKMKNHPTAKAGALASLALFAAVNAQGASTFDPSINRLFITSVSVNGANYQNVSANINSYTLLAVDNGTPGSDTFNPDNNLLILGSVAFLGTTYNNVRVQLNAFTLLAATLVPATPDGVLTAANTCSLPNFQTDLMALINQARASSRTCGSTVYPAVAAVAWNSKLFDAAAGHSADMANQNYFSHTSLDGRTAGQRITAAGYSWSAYGENIAAGQSSAASVMDAWIASAGHCSNIMASNFKDVAVACVSNSGSTYKRYWTMALGR